MSVFFKANPSCLLFLISSVFLTSLSTGSFFRACKLDKVLFKVFFKNTYILKKKKSLSRTIQRELQAKLGEGASPRSP